MSAMLYLMAQLGILTAIQNLITAIVVITILYVVIRRS